MSIEDRVRRVLVDEFDLEPDQIRPEARFVEDLDADSLETSVPRMQTKEVKRPL